MCLINQQGLDIKKTDESNQHMLIRENLRKILEERLKNLNKLAKEGKLEAIKMKRNWMTTKEAVERYTKEHKLQRKR